MTEICGQIISVDVLVVKLRLDRQFVILWIGILFTEGTDRNRSARIILRYILLNQGKTNTGQRTVSSGVAVILHFCIITAPVPLIWKTDFESCNVRPVFHVDARNDIVNATFSTGVKDV